MSSTGPSEQASAHPPHCAQLRGRAWAPPRQADPGGTAAGVCAPARFREVGPGCCISVSTMLILGELGQNAAPVIRNYLVDSFVWLLRADEQSHGSINFQSGIFPQDATPQSCGLWGDEGSHLMVISRGEIHQADPSGNETPLPPPGSSPGLTRLRPACGCSMLARKA